MAVRTKSAALVGIDAIEVDIEAEIFGLLKRFVIVGLPDGVVREARERVRCAMENSGFHFPHSEVVVSLAPASLPKYGAGFDLAIALSILGACGEINPEALRSHMFLGELALDGSIKPAGGALACARLAAKSPGTVLVAAEKSARVAAVVNRVKAVGVRTLLEAAAMLQKRITLPNVEPANLERRDGEPALGFGDVVAQEGAKRAIEIAAAGGHNLLLIGPPGAGKTMLARRMTSILPPMCKEEILEVSQIYGALNAAACESGCCPAEQPLVLQRPFRAPHHSLSVAALVGGGSIPAPGEVSLAHRGILLLDEFLEIRRDAVEALREPLESRQIVIARARMRLCFPADFTLVAAANPCPCGKRGFAGNGAAGAPGCQCSAAALHRYATRLSGPIVDRIDLSVWVAPVPLECFHQEHSGDQTPQMRERVCAARDRQAERFSRRDFLNCRMTTREIKTHCKIGEHSQQMMERAAKKFSLSARSYTKVLKVARTIADIEGEKLVSGSHLAEALSYRLRTISY